MKEVSESNEVDGKIHMTFSDFSSICPYTRKKDFGEVEIAYTPGKYRIDEARLEDYLASFQGREVPMELVPIETLTFLMEECLSKHPPTRYASPEEAEVKVTFHKRPKKWGMNIHLKFARTIT